MLLRVMPMRLFPLIGFPDDSEVASAALAPAEENPSATSVVSRAGTEHVEGARQPGRGQRDVTHGESNDSTARAPSRDTRTHPMGRTPQRHLASRMSEELLDAIRDAMVRKRVAAEAARAAEEKFKRLRAKSDKLNPPNPVDPEEQD